MRFTRTCISGLLLLAVFQLSLAAEGLPDALTLDLGAVENVGSNVTVVLTKRSVRSDAYVFGTWGADGFKKLDPVPVSTYRGYVEGDPAMRVNANIEPGGVFNANFSDGALINATVTDRKITVETGKSTPNMTAGNKVVPLKKTRSAISPGGYLLPPQPMRRIQFAIDLSNKYVEEVGGDLALAVSQVEQRMNDGDFVYARDVGVAWEIAAFVIREEACPGIDWSKLVDVDAGRYFNLVAMFLGNTGRPRSWGGPVFRTHDPMGGPAPISVARVNVRNASGLVHEAGHKFRAAHNVDNADVMRGARSRLGSSNIQLVLPHCEGRPESIFPAVVYNGSLPPFAMTDHANTTEGTPVTIDVTENDYDGNGEAVTLLGVVPKSDRGGTVALTEDKKQVRYTPPAGFAGADHFTYTIADASGVPNRAGEVKVDVGNDGLLAYLTLDGLAGDGKIPVQGPCRGESGVYVLQPSFHKGVKGNAMFNDSLGTRGYVVIAGVGDPGRESLSVSLWVCYPSVRSLAADGIIACKGACYGGGVGGGFVLSGWGIGHRPGGEGFVFAGNVARHLPDESFELHSSEPVKPGAWYHLVMVMDRKTKKMRAWVNNREVVNPEQRVDIPDGVIECYHGLTFFNGFNYKGGRACACLVDEVKIFRGVLTPEQIAALYRDGSNAGPPPDLKGEVTVWSAEAGAMVKAETLDAAK